MIRFLFGVLVGFELGIIFLDYLRKRGELKMYEVTISIDGILKTIHVNAKDGIQAQEIITNMYGNGKVQIINVRRK